MEVSQRIAVTGMLANARQLDVVSNNLANVSSTAFKRAVAHTTDVGYQAGLDAPVGPNGAIVRLVGIGQGTQLADVSNEFMPGALMPTGNSLDAALQGDGFFQVSMPDGTAGYTRDGTFTLDATGQLVTASGLQVQSDTGAPMLVPPDSLQVRLDDTGQLVVTDATGAEQFIGRLGLSQFPNNGGLQASGQNIWTPTVASGAAMAVVQGAATAPLVIPGALEGSNVSMADEFTRLIQAQRGYQLNSKVVQAWDDIERMANDLHG
jgi:flagellar basal-body rod protein FlgG